MIMLVVVNYSGVVYTLKRKFDHIIIFVHICIVVVVVVLK